LKTATKLNIEIGIFNSPGWSQSGGPWVKPSQAMRYLAASEVKVKGGQNLDIQLHKPAADFQDVRVIAFPVMQNFGTRISNANATISVTPEIKNAKALMDGDTSIGISFPNADLFTLDFEMTHPDTMRSVVFYTTLQRMVLDGEIQAAENGIYHTVKSFRVDRSNGALNVGFVPYPPGAVSIPETISSHFRILFHHVTSKACSRKLCGKNVGKNVPDTLTLLERIPVAGAACSFRSKAIDKSFLCYRHFPVHGYGRQAHLEGAGR
jgi:hypothetical protein